MELSFQPTVKTPEEADFELWEDLENSVKITIEPNSQEQSYRFMGEEMERNAAGMWGG